MATFTATQWDTEADKEKFVKQFMRFVDSGFKWTLFPKWFYTRLSMTFGHIAHHDRHGFYAEWFSTQERQLRFLRHTVGWTSHGDPAWTYSDAERAIQRILAGRPEIFTSLQARIVAATERHERAELERLQAKYGVK